MEIKAACESRMLQARVAAQRRLFGLAAQHVNTAAGWMATYEYVEDVAAVEAEESEGLAGLGGSTAGGSQAGGGTSRTSGSRGSRNSALVTALGSTGVGDGAAAGALEAIVEGFVCRFVRRRLGHAVARG